MERRNFKPNSCRLTANGPESVHRAVELAQRFSAHYGLAPSQRAKLSIVVEEAVTNLYDHGAGQAGFEGWLALDDSAGSVQVVLADNGQPFDPRDMPEPDMPNAERGGGAGLALIRAWAEIAGYRRENGFNLLEIVLPA